MNSIYEDPIADIEELIEMITNKIEEISDTPKVLQNVIESLKR